MQVPQTDKEETATLLERQALILEEVAAEFGFSGEVDTTEEQAEQVCATAECSLGLRSSCLSSLLCDRRWPVAS